MLLWRKERVLLMDPHRAVLAAYFEVLHDRFEVINAQTIGDALRSLELERPVAILADWETSYGQEGQVFRELIRARWPSVRILDFATHLAPHVDTLRHLRLHATAVRSEPRPCALLDALIASAEDPVLESPFAN